MFRVTQALYAAASKTAATATVRAVKRSRLIPTRAALTLVRIRKQIAKCNLTLCFVDPHEASFDCKCSRRLQFFKTTNFGQPEK